MISASRALQKLNLRMLVIIAAGFQLWDALITHVYVNKGYVCEGNPLMASLIREGLFLPERAISIVISVVLLYLLSRFSKKIAASAATGVIALYSAVLIWNYAVLLMA